MEKFPPGGLTPEVKCMVRHWALAAVGAPRCTWGRVTRMKNPPLKYWHCSRSKMVLSFQMEVFLNGNIPVVYFSVVLCLFMCFFQLKNENKSSDLGQGDAIPIC